MLQPKFNPLTWGNHKNHSYASQARGIFEGLGLHPHKGIVKKPVYLQFVMGILGGIPATPENLVFLHDTARRQIGDFQFSVCAAGNSQIPICTQSLIMGGHARELGIEPATPAEARRILGLKGLA